MYARIIDRTMTATATVLDYEYTAKYKTQTALRDTTKQRNICMIVSKGCSLFYFKSNVKVRKLVIPVGVCLCDCKSHAKENNK